MNIKTLHLGALNANCYIVQTAPQQCIAVDIGGTPRMVIEYLKMTGLKLTKILLTHGHFDHIMGVDGFLKEFSIPVYVHEDDRDAMNDARLNQSRTYTSGYTFSDAVYVKDQEILKLAGYDMEVIHTPGHTMGCCCYYIASEDVLFSGDTLFQNSVGRTDFENSSTSALVRSVRERLFVLPDDTHVYPGHSGETMIGYEKTHNPYV